MADLLFADDCVQKALDELQVSHHRTWELLKKIAFLHTNYLTEISEHLENYWGALDENGGEHFSILENLGLISMSFVDPNIKPKPKPNQKVQVEWGVKFQNLAGQFNGGFYTRTRLKPKTGERTRKIAAMDWVVLEGIKARMETDMKDYFDNLFQVTEFFDQMISSRAEVNLLPHIQNLVLLLRAVDYSQYPDIYIVALDTVLKFRLRFLHAPPLRAHLHDKTLISDLNELQHEISRMMEMEGDQPLNGDLDSDHLDLNGDLEQEKENEVKMEVDVEMDVETEKEVKNGPEVKVDLRPENPDAHSERFPQWLADLRERAKIHYLESSFIGLENIRRLPEPWRTLVGGGGCGGASDGAILSLDNWSSFQEYLKISRNSARMLVAHHMHRSQGQGLNFSRSHQLRTFVLCRQTFLSWIRQQIDEHPDCENFFSLGFDILAFPEYSAFNSTPVLRWAGTFQGRQWVRLQMHILFQVAPIPLGRETEILNVGRAFLQNSAEQLDLDDPSLSSNRVILEILHNMAALFKKNTRRAELFRSLCTKEDDLRYWAAIFNFYTKTVLKLSNFTWENPELWTKNLETLIKEGWALGDQVEGIAIGEALELAKSLYKRAKAKAS